MKETERGTSVMAQKMSKGHSSLAFLKFGIQRYIHFPFCLEGGDSFRNVAPIALQTGRCLTSIPII